MSHRRREDYVKAMKTTDTLIDSHAIDKFQALIKDVRMAMLTTVASDGSLRSRPMATLSSKFDGDLWFFTADDSPKVDEIVDENHVAVAYSSPQKEEYVSVSGLASIVRDRERARALWTPFAKAWFPGGIDDPHLALLRVKVRAIEYWDSPSSKMVQLYGLAKAILTGEKPKNLGEHEKINLGAASEEVWSRG
jgi:general stress protein 26